MKSDYQALRCAEIIVALISGRYVIRISISLIVFLVFLSPSRQSLVQIKLSHGHFFRIMNATQNNVISYSTIYTKYTVDRAALNKPNFVITQMVTLCGKYPMG